MKVSLIFIVLIALSTMLVGGLVSCTDSGIDPDTAVIIGEGKDTIKQIEFQKAYVLAGIIGIEGNIQTDGFVTFRREYSVDSLRNGAVTGLKDVYLKADFRNGAAPNTRHAFYPLEELEVFVPALEVPTRGAGTVLPLEAFDANRKTGGLKANFRHNNDAVELSTGKDDSLSTGYAQITSIDPQQRTVSLFVAADLVNTTPASGSTRRIVDRMVIEIALEIPY